MSSNAPSSTSELSPAPPAGPGPAWQRPLPGLALCAALAAAATFVAGLHQGPVMLYALLFGAAFHYQSSEPHSAPGIAWAAGPALRLGIGLVGARIGAEQWAGLGPGTVAVVLLGVASTLALGLGLARLLRLPRALGLLAGGASAICGASAALALAAVLPRGERHERDTLAVVVIATLLSTAAMVSHPLIARLLDLPPAAAGLFIGGSIQDLAQVIVAGYTLGPATGDAATLVKLLRVALLVGVVAAAASWLARTPHARAEGASPGRGLPWFLWLFLALAGLRTLGWLPLAALPLLDNASRACLLTGVAAWGAKTSLPALARCGWATPLLMLACAAWLGGGMLVAAHFMR